MQSFSDLCLKVYFSEERSPYDFISVNAGLFSLFSDHASTAQTSQDDQECNIAYVRLCRENLETALAELPLQLPASANVIAALLFGVGLNVRSGDLTRAADITLGLLLNRVLHFLSVLVLVFKSI